MKGRKSPIRKNMLEYLKKHERATRKDLRKQRGDTSLKNADYHIRKLLAEGLIVAIQERGEDGYKQEWFYLADKRPGIPPDYLEYLINASWTEDKEKQERVQSELRDLLYAQGVDGEETLKLVLNGWEKAEAKGSENVRVWRKFLWNLAKNLRKRNSDLLTNMREETSDTLVKLAMNTNVESDDRGTAFIVLQLLENKNAELVAWKMMLDPDDSGYDEMKTAPHLAVKYAQKDYYTTRKTLYDLLGEDPGKDPIVRRRVLDLLDRLERR